MVIALIGESCTGKSTVAAVLKEKIRAEVFTGKDYLRLSKNKDSAKGLFEHRLEEASASDENIIYVISEKEDLPLLPSKVVRVLFISDIETIKARFAKRMGVSLPETVERMLISKHGIFDTIPADLKVSSDRMGTEEILGLIIGKVNINRAEL